MGGLGNQIFQIFTTISYAIKTNNQFKFISLDKLGSGTTTVRNTYWNSFFSKLKLFLINDFSNFNVMIKEKDFTFNELPINEMKNKNIKINGYFQSYKYFESEFKTICKLINLDIMKQNVMEKIYKNDINLKNCISLHFRIGDYKKIQEFHPLMNFDYYKKAIEYLLINIPINNLSIIYFYEEDDLEDVNIIINKLKIDFPNINFISIEKGLEDWEQLLYMSLIPYNIIANSSFSWWGAYFNFNENKIVCYPSIWFGEKSNINTKDLCPEEWIKINAY